MPRALLRLLFGLSLLAACARESTDDATSGAPADGAGDAERSPPSETEPGPWASGPKLGARRTPEGDLEIRVRAPHATRVEVALFAKAFGEKERLRKPLEKVDDILAVRIASSELARAGVTGTVYYGLRAFGPNWTFDPAFEPGSLTGFVADVDEHGNRMNPNKLLLDPYALEVSHDPITVEHGDGAVYQGGEDTRQLDSGPFAMKGIVVASPRASVAGPPRALADDVVYEVHLRGFTKSDPSVPEDERGTYAGAARKAGYLRALGVTAIELLPLHETQNDQNERTPESQGDNYWGYSSLSFFAPDRRYARDRSPGGPTRELRAMVEAFHAEGIKVWLDVVFNHTAEGGGSIYSMRGLDNATFYEIADDARGYVNSNGVGPNVNTKAPVTSDLVVASLRYWHDVLGFDGFRFDLASVVANRCERGCYEFEREGILKRIADDLPARSDEGGAGVDLIAEPWGLAGGSYQVGGFPKGWAEWNDRFRDAVRSDLNRAGVDAVTPREIARRVSGSPDLYADDKRPPSASINFVVAHDGMTLADLFSYDHKNNRQAWPFGPSDGGTDADRAYGHGGDPRRQRTATRTAFALLALSAGVPMLTGGDERLRTQRGNNNAYNLDSPGIWLDWAPRPEGDAFARFVSRILAFRAEHRALRPSAFWNDGSGVRWVKDDGGVADGGYLDSADNHYVGWLLDGALLGDKDAALFVAYNGWANPIEATLPLPPKGRSWQLAFDTSAGAEGWDNWIAPAARKSVTESAYLVGQRAAAVFVAK